MPTLTEQIWEAREAALPVLHAGVDAMAGAFGEPLDRKWGRSLTGYKGITASQIYWILDGSHGEWSKFVEALDTFGGPYLTPQSIGTRLRQARHRVSLGRKLDCVRIQNTSYWTVVSTPAM